MRLHDIAFRDGRFFIPWGPVPGLLLAGLHTVRDHAVGDHSLTVVFLCGLLIFNALFLTWAKERLYPDLSSRAVVPGLLLVGLCHPILWVLGRPAIYEAAIAGGQAFLIAGIYWGLSALGEDRPVVWKLALAGLALALAVGSRVSIGLTIGFLAMGLVWSLWARRSQVSRRHLGVAIVALAAPLAIGTMLLALYNYVRFGSVFEFGQRFQLAGINQHRVFENHQAASLGYVLPHLLHYLALPFRVVSDTPFLVPLQGYSQPVADLHVPNLVFEHVTGVLWGVPFVWFVWIPIGAGLARLIGGSGPSRGHSFRAEVVRGTSFKMCNHTMLGGVALLGLLPLLPFYGGAMRYLMDFTPALALLSVLGFWDGLRYCSSRPMARALFLSVAGALLAGSVFLGIYFGVYSAHLQYSLY